jgi:hypothetical protein
MRVRKVLTIAAAGCALAASAMLPASAGAAGAAHPAVGSVKVFHSTLNNHSPKPGQKLILKGTGALKHAKYDCVLVVIKGSKYTVGPITNVKSTASGHVTCSVTYRPYTAQSLSGGASQKCPLSAKLKKAHYRCGIAVSNLAMTSTTIQYFSPKK